MDQTGDGTMRGRVYFSRRSFLGSLTASVVVPGSLGAEVPVTRIGVVSDPHVTLDGKTVEPLQKAFRHFSAEGVDTVVISGDLCHGGTMIELENIMVAWREAFPNGCNVNGGHVFPFFVWGNHDYLPTPRFHDDELKKKAREICILHNKDEAWRMVTGETRHPGEVFLRKSGGVTFVGAHWGAEARLGMFLKDHGSEIPDDRPVIYVQHPHPKGTCFSGWSTHDDGRNHDVLMAHPNFFCISGHSHISVSFDDALWSGGFVSMGAGSMRVTGCRTYEYNTSLTKRHMAGAPSGDAQQASILSIYADRVVVSRHEYRKDDHLGEDWNLPFPFRHNAEHPYVIAEAAPPPQFRRGTTIRVEQREGLLYPDRTKELQTCLTFKPAMSTGPHSRVIDYRVVVTRKDSGALVVERLVEQGLLGLSEKRSREFNGYCTFGPEELPCGVRLVATVTPLNAAKKGGDPIMVEFVINENTKVKNET